MKSIFKILFTYPLFLVMHCCPFFSLAQNEIPRFNKIYKVQRDTSNFYFNEIWIKSKDINIDDPYGYTSRANSKIQKGYYKEAKEDIDKSIKIDSTISNNYSLKAYCYLQQDSIIEALSYFNKALTLDSSSSINYYYLGDIYLGLNELEKADSFYNKCIILDPNFYNAYFGKANIAYLKGEFKDSEKLYKKVISLNPNHTISYFNLAFLYSKSNQKKTLKYLNKTIEVSPDFAVAYYYRGYLKMKNNSKNRATLKDWDKAIEIDSLNLLYRLSRISLKISNRNNEGMDELIALIEKSELNDFSIDFEKSFDKQRFNDFLFQMTIFSKHLKYLTTDEKNQIKKAMALFFKKKYINTDKIYSKLIEQTANKGLIYFLMAYNQEYLNNNLRSLENYKNAKNQSIFPIETYLRLGVVNLSLNNYLEAINNLNYYINKFDSTKLAYRCRGISFVQLQKFDSALFDFDNFIKLDSTESDIYFNKAICYKAIEEYNKAIDNFNYAIKYKSIADMETLVLISECYYLKGDTLNALNKLCEASDSYRWLSQNGYYLRGQIYLHYLKYDSAISDFNNYIRFNKNNIQALKFRGKAYYDNRNYTQALEDFNQVLILDNEDLNALYARGLIFIKLEKRDLALQDFQLAESLGHPNARKAINFYFKDAIPIK